MFTVTDLKQMAYCPRIVYYDYCLPGVRVVRTVKMALGRAANDATEALEHRRSLRTYGLRDATREYDVWLESESLGLRGRLDMLVITPDELIPVDFKDSTTGFEADAKRVSRPVQHNWALQLAAYGLLVEATHGQAVRRGFIYYIPARRAREVVFTEDLRREVLHGVDEMRKMVETERQPEPTPFRERCAACEFRRLCNDV